MNFSNSYHEGIYRAKVDIVRQVYKKYYQLCLDENLPLPPELKELRKVYNDNVRLSNARIDAKIYMLTLNPPDEVDWESLSSCVEHLVNFKGMLIDPQIEYEQRSEDVDNPHGFHVHIACKLGRSTRNVIDTVARTLQRYCPNSTRNSVDLRLSRNAYSYVDGDKGDPSKIPKMSVDQKLREKYSLFRVYKKDGL